MAHYVFISYSAKDRAIAEKVCVTLEANGIACWIAPRDLVAGTYSGAIIKAINSSKIIVLILSSHANQSPQVLREVERAVSKGKIIYPFRIEEILPSEDLEFFISSQHWLDAFDPPIERHLKRLAENVVKQLEVIDRANQASASTSSDMLSATILNFSSSASPPHGLDEWIDGIWEGTAYQIDIGKTYLLKLTVQNKKYTIEYPSLPCKGEWILISIDSSKAKFKEKILQGPCVDNGDILIERVTDSQITYRHSVSGTNEVACSATLNRKYIY